MKLLVTGVPSIAQQDKIEVRSGSLEKQMIQEIGINKIEAPASPGNTSLVRKVLYRLFLGTTNANFDFVFVRSRAVVHRYTSTVKIGFWAASSVKSAVC